MNFDAIWISPIVAQLPQRTGDGEAYTAYWQQDLYALNPKFGSQQDLHDLIAAVHDKGMYLMLDIVVNHMGYAGLPLEVDYSVLNPFDDQRFYHDYFPVVDPTNATNVETGWLGDTLVSLADLRTEDDEVRDMFGEWVSGLVSNYSVDGLRIDTSVNVEPDFFPSFVDAAGVFATGEVMQGDTSQACVWADSIGSVLNYMIYFPLTRAFQSPLGSIDDLVQTINSIKTNCADPTSLGSFSESHDVERFATLTDDMSLAKNLVTFTIMADGIPIIYQGQEQHMSGGTSPCNNRAPLWETGFDTSAPLYQHIATLNKFRQHVTSNTQNYTTYMSEVIYQDFHSIGMRKGFDGSQVITVLNNNGETINDFVLNVPDHGYAAGVQLTEILSCTFVTVNGTGYLNLPMDAGHPKVLYPTTLLYGSSLCNMPDEAPMRAPAPTATTITTTRRGGRPTTMTIAQTTTSDSWASPRRHKRHVLGHGLPL